MTSTPTSGPLPAADRPHRRLLRLAGYTLGIGSVVAVLLSLLFNQRLGSTLVYSWCISLGCSLCIDVFRGLASRWVYRHEAVPSAAAQARWPGWRWMSACLLLGTLAGFTLGAELGNWLTGGRAASLFGGGRTTGLSLLIVSLLPGLAATYYFRAKAQLQSAQALADAAQRQATETRLKLLESQLEPHMLFNTLANLRALIGVDPERAQAMLDRMIDFLRATLSASRAPLHPLQAEFDRLADYLALMQVRMGDRLRTELDLPVDLAQTPVPPLVLQPLVENAIKHGLEPKRGGGLIRVQATREAGDLVLSVVDTGVGLNAATSPTTEPGGGFGLAQVRERLATLYGSTASFTLAAGPTDSGGTQATLRWPLTDHTASP
ncbi:MAG: histidine kinase [Burkholderiaceae bacterium]